MVMTPLLPGTLVAGALDLYLGVLVPLAAAYVLAPLAVDEARFGGRDYLVRRRLARAEGERVLVVAFAAMPAQRHGAGARRESLRGKSREARLASARRPQDRVSPRASNALFRRSRVCSMAWRGNARDALV